MPNLLLVTVPTDEVMNKAGDKVRFPAPTWPSII